MFTVFTGSARSEDSAVKKTKKKVVKKVPKKTKKPPKEDKQTVSLMSCFIHMYILLLIGRFYKIEEDL